MVLSLKALRVNQGLSQKELGKLMGITQTSISAWETGTAKPSSKNVYELAKIYGVDTSVIFSAIFKQTS